MPKRTTQDRRKAEQQPEQSTGAQRDSFTITTLPIKEGDDESDESYYSGLDSEPDTTNSSSNSGDDDIVGEQDCDIEEESILNDYQLSDDIDNASEQGSHDPVNIYAESDTSDEEDARNTVGNIPMNWYDDYPHIGYDLDGKKIMKPAKGDELDKFLAKMDDPDYWRTIEDKYSGKQMLLNDGELDIIQKIQQREFPEASVDPYPPQINFFTYEKMDQPLKGGTEPKRRFVPSKWEAKKVMKIVHAIRMGWIKPSAKKDTEKPNYYLLWNETSDADKDKKHHVHIPAPRMKLPGHDESYNPPPEYLPTPEEKEKWEQEDPQDRERNFLPQSYASLREVPAYPRFIQERFERCLDLYLCPRQRRMKVKIDNPDILLPKLPKPKDLQPFPSTESIVYTGHTAMVRCIDVEPFGQWLSSGSGDNTLKLWEVSTGRCMNTITLESTPDSVAFCPNQELTLIAVAIGKGVWLINHGLGDKLAAAHTDQLITSVISSDDDANEPTPVTWSCDQDDTSPQRLTLQLTLPKPVKQVTWHTKGDYFATVMPEGGNQAVYIHQLTKKRSQNPFQRSKGLVQKVLFHPTKPLFFVATQRYVRIYDLVKQELVKKLLTGVKWISSIDIHPQGDNLIIGSYDKRLCWFDLELSTKPYKVTRQHKQAVRQVSYHRRYPLFASASDDGTAIVSHGMVYSDLLKNPLIVPLKILKGHSIVNNFGILDIRFHPVQPWLFTAGADSLIRLYT